MRKKILSIALLLVAFSLFSCDKNTTEPQEEHYVRSKFQPNDLIPLTNGNKYVYDYYESFDNIDVTHECKASGGYEGWTITDKEIDNIIFFIEKFIRIEGDEYIIAGDTLSKFQVGQKMIATKWGNENGYIFTKEEEGISLGNKYKYKVIYEIIKGIGIVNCKNWGWDFITNDYVLFSKYELVDFNLK